MYRTVSLEQTFSEAAEAMARPAGRRPEFESLEAIAEHRKAFVLACHETWRVWHGRAIEQILTFDQFLRLNKAAPVPGGDEFGNRICAVWRKVNDSIVWSLFGANRWVVKRLCLYRPRTYLTESNASSVLKVLASLNANPMSLALWSDATSVVDMGDIVYVEDGLRPEPSFIELKEGKVNAEIIELLDLHGEEFAGRFRSFAQTRGKKGVKQFERVVRQRQTGQQMGELLSNLRGRDPVTGREIEIVDVGADHVPYDETLGALLEGAAERGSEVCELVEDCIWIYVGGDPKADRVTAHLRFRYLLEENGVSLPLSSVNAAHDRDCIVDLQWGNFQPLAKPLFIRTLKPEIVGALVGGRLLHKVFLYVDWPRFAELCARCGTQFTWSTEKDARRMRAEPPELRAALVRGRVAQIRVEDVRVSVTDPALVQMLFDGTPPRAIIEHTITSALRLKSRSLK
jgi:hypothetical protein